MTVRAFRPPYLRISGPGEANLVDRLSRDFVGVRITDLEGGESDELTIRIRRRKPYRLPPAPETPFTVHVGWDATSAAMTGTYLFQRIGYTGDPEAGEEMQLVCRAADFTDALKRVDSEHFDEENGHHTYGDVFRTIAARAGLGAAIDPEIAKIPLAGGYLLRWKQSAIGLATDLSDELGAIVKPQAGKLTVRRQGSFQSPSGESLPPIRVVHDPDYGWQADIEPRYGFKEVSGSWFNSGSGRPVDALKSLGRGAGRLALPHLVGSEALATAMSAAAAQRLEAETATAVFEMPGNAAAVAGAPVKPEGYGPDVDGLSWEAEAVYHEVGPDRGWITTVEARLAM